jgi:uncharacterized protein DUF2510
LSTPGWYPDPEDPASVRFFDGNRWTAVRQPVDTLPRYQPEPIAAHVTSAPYRPAAYHSPAPVLEPPPATDYLPAARDDDWRPGPPRRRAAAPSRRRRPVVIAVCAALLAGGLTAGWFAVHKSSSNSFTFDGKAVDDPSATLVQAERSVDAIVAGRHGVKSPDTRCYFAVPDTPAKGAKKTDVDSALRCGPVLFVDGDPARTYLTYPLNSTPGNGGSVKLTASARPINTQPGLPPLGFELRRPDEQSTPTGSALAVPPPQPARPDTLVAADLGAETLSDAPAGAVMVALRGGVKLTKVGQIGRYGTGDAARGAPPGRRLVAFTYMYVPGQVANNSPAPNQLGVSVNGGAARRLPPVKGTQAVVVAVPNNGRADLVLDADGVRQTLALPSGAPGTRNLAVLRRTSIDATVAVNRPISFRFNRPGNVTTLAGTLTVTHALLGYWTDDGQHHASDGNHALLWMDFRFQAPHQARETGVDAPLLKLTPAGGQSIVAKDVDPTSRVFAVFEVPATFAKGTVTISGSESGNPAISVVTPISFPVTIPN